MTNSEFIKRTLDNLDSTIAGWPILPPCACADTTEKEES